MGFISLASITTVAASTTCTAVGYPFVILSLTSINYTFPILFSAAVVAICIFMGYLFRRFFESPRLVGNQLKTYRRVACCLIVVTWVAIIFEIMTMVFSPPNRPIGFVTYIVSTWYFIWRHTRSSAFHYLGEPPPPSIWQIYNTSPQFFITMVIALIMSVFAVVWVIRIKKYSAFPKFQSRLLGGLMIISFMLFVNSSTLGWLVPAVIVEEPRYTSCGNWHYHIEFAHWHSGHLEPTLVVRNTNTNDTQRIWLQGLLRETPPGGRRGTWANLVPTMEPYVFRLRHTNIRPYLFQLSYTNTVNYFYPEYSVSLEYGTSYARIVASVMPVAVGPFMYTYDGRFRYRLEDTYLMRHTGHVFHRTNRGIRIFIHDLETETEQSFLLDAVRCDDIRHNMLHEPVKLDPTDTPHLYIIRFQSGLETFYVNPVEGTYKQVHEYIYGSWRISPDGQVEYRIKVYNNYTPSREGDSLMRRGLNLEIRGIYTGATIMYSLSLCEDVLRSYMTNSREFDWVSVLPRTDFQWRWMAGYEPEWWFNEALHTVTVIVPSYEATPPTLATGFTYVMVVDIEKGVVLDTDRR